MVDKAMNKISVIKNVSLMTCGAGYAQKLGNNEAPHDKARKQKTVNPSFFVK